MTAAQGFFDARDLLLRHRTDYQRAYSEFRWPELAEFNWALDYFDVVPDVKYSSIGSFACVTASGSNAALAA